MKDPFAELRISRRNTLKLMVAAGFVPFSRNLAAAPASEPILKRHIPGTDETLPAVGLGTSDEFETLTSDNRGLLTEVLRRFIALGGEVVDTAPIYGNAEAVIGELVSELGAGDRLFMATKVRSRGAQAGLEQMRASQRRLKAKTLDLMQVHSLVDVATQLDNLRHWKEQGRVRYIGITHSRISAFGDLERLMRNEPLDFVQLNYSVTTPEAEERLLPLAADKGIAVLVNRPFENGTLFRRTKNKPLPDWASDFDCQSWAQFSLKYILAHPAVTCVIPATSNPEHLVDNMGAGTGRLPDEATRRRMRAYTANL